jgi:hypothetical protein
MEIKTPKFKKGIEKKFEKWLKENCKGYIGGKAENIISEKICPGDLYELRATETFSKKPETFQI